MAGAVEAEAAAAGVAEAGAAGASSLLNRTRLTTQLAAEQAAGMHTPASITGYSQHALKQILLRDGGIGVNKAALEDAWMNPLKIEYTPTQYGPTFRYTGKNAVIVVNPNGLVVTGWPMSSAGVGK